MPLDVMVEKAFRLVRDGKIEEIGEGRFNVVGDHGTYTVQMSPIGRLTCNCQGFSRRKMCSHVAAVIIYRDLKPSKPIS
ncbi:MAG: SWIM zinc finger family protein [Nitrososphaerota archaeon]|nr:SWIM zinc finger family protein [Candidatus Bathyarchaeota archaeon]MCX8162394.1 SWIM zinc finger family protein [Candidatus Bathyarchaeota archaeon]MDW8061343.1 SWIM zinc finger family protein [Nitrososphaerota archaeon]